MEDDPPETRFLSFFFSSLLCNLAIHLTYKSEGQGFLRTHTHKHPKIEF